MCKIILFCSADWTARFGNKLGSQMLTIPSFLQNCQTSSEL